MLQAPGSRLIVVGTAPDANDVQAIGLRLRVAKCEPSGLTFAPYKKEAIEAVLEKRVLLLPGPVFTPSAVRALLRLVSPSPVHLSDRFDVLSQMLDATTEPCFAKLGLSSVRGYDKVYSGLANLCECICLSAGREAAEGKHEEDSEVSPSSGGYC